MADVSGVTELLAKTSVDQLIEVSFSGKGLKLNSAEDAREVVAAVEACEGIQSLKLNGNTIGVEAAQALAKALESKPQFQRARWSDMFTGRLRSEIPPALMSLGAGIMTAGAHLVEIDLSDNAFGPDGVKAVRELLESSSCYSLREMRFNNNGLGIGGKLMAEALITCHEKSTKAGKPLALKVFIAGRNRLENPGATALAKAFKIIGTLEEIALPQNGINYEGITALAEAVEYSHNLKILNLNDNTFTARGAKPMAKAIKNLSKLEVINFGDCLVRSEGADAIANSLREGVPSLKELNLAFGEIKKEAAVRVAESMDTKPHLTLLDLNGNNIGEEGIELIQGIMDANNHADALGTLSDDEVSEDEEDDDDDEYEDVEDDEDVEEEKGGQESKDPHLQVKGTAISPRREVTKYMIPVTAADFLANPTAEKLQAVGPERAVKILQELGNEVREESAKFKIMQANANRHGEEILRDQTNEEFEEIALMKMFVKISSVMNSENNDVKNAVYQCTDAILKKLCSSEKFTPESIATLLVCCMQPFKGAASGMLLALEHAIKQQYYPESSTALWIRNGMMALLSSINVSTSTQSYLKLCTVNVGSVRSKSAAVYDFVCESKADLYAMTETWLTDNDSAIIHDIAPAGYRFVHHPRAGRRGGGTALLFKDTINVHQVVAGEKRSFEFACYYISFRFFQLLLINIYRPPHSPDHHVTTNDFFPEFKKFIKKHLSYYIPVIITGDINIHVDIDKKESRSFMDLLDSLSCTQYVDFPTHKHGHTLDLVITRKSDKIIVGRPCRGSLISDHFSVVSQLYSVEAPVPSMKTSFREIGCIDMDSLKNDVANSSLCLNTPDDLTELFTLYTDTLSSIFNKHAPLKTKTVTSHPEVPWLTDDVIIEKIKRQEAENKWLETKSLQDYDNFKEARDKALSVMNEARKNYYFDMIKENSSDQGSLVNVTKPLLNMTSLNQVIPAHVDKRKFVNDLGQFFCDKIVRIHSDINSAVDDGTCTPDIFSDPTDFQISRFKKLSVKDVKKLVTNLSNESCFLDPMPIKLVLKCTESLLPVFTKIINLSLSKGVFPSDCKVALVEPILINHGMELSFNNLRPVSNLPFISRLVEGAVTQQIEEHICRNALFPSMQSASSQFHSTETASVRIHNDLLLAMDNKKVTLVVLLDLSAAFDTIDHGILLKILQSSCGLSDHVLSWIKSYLSNRQQQLILDDVISEHFHVHVPCGVPQGSRLGPLLFTLFTSNLIKIIQKFPNVSCHRYADNTQLYISFSPDKEHQDDNISILKSCIRYIRSVMFQHKLMLNDEKTEYLIVGTSRQDAKLDINWIKVGESEVKPRFNMEKHISDTCKYALYMLHNLCHIRRYLDRKSTESLVHEYITSRLDYCNGLLFGLPDSQIKKLQDVQDDCARLVHNNAPKSYKIKPVLKKLRWLPIKQGIEFKILLLVYKALNEHAPKYLSELLYRKSISHEHNLRSTQDKLLLKLPHTKTKVTLGDRAFSCAAPKLWNNLPLNIRDASSVDVFKDLLETHLLSGAFE